MCKISIIVPIYNSEKYLRKCIESVLKQNYDSYELILIDDGSTDRSGIICDEYANKYGKVNVVHKENKGVSNSRNIGIKKARGEYILFLDSDDWLEENSLIKINRIIREKKVDVLVFGYKEVYENNNTVNLKPYRNIRENDFEKIVLDISDNIKGFLFNKLIKKSCIEYYFDESVYVKEDLYFLLQNRANFKKIYIIQDVVYNYQIRCMSVSHSNKKNEKYISTLKVDKYIFENIHSNYGDEYKTLFLEEYFNLCFYLNGINKKKLKNKYGNLQKQCYKEIIKSSNVKRKIKMKIFIEKYFQMLYRINRKIKSRK